MAKCKICNATFKIDGGGLSQVKSHSKSKKHMDSEKVLSGESSQTKFITDNKSGVCQLSKGEHEDIM